MGTVASCCITSSRCLRQVVNWNIGNVLMVLHEVAEWVQWSRETATHAFYTWLGLVIAATEYGYYICFKVSQLSISTCTVCLWLPVAGWVLAGVGLHMLLNGAPPEFHGR